MRFKTFLSSIALCALVACGDSSTSPTEIPTSAPSPQPPAAATVTPVVVEPTAPAPTGNSSGVDIDDAGTVTSESGKLSATACLYAWPAQDKLFHSYPVSNGTPLQLPAGWCGEADLQLDVQRGAVCPSNGFANAWDGFLKGRAHVKVKRECPKPEPTPQPTPTPTPTPQPTPSPSPSPEPTCVSSMAVGPRLSFSLPNSSPTSEESWVDSNVLPGPYYFVVKVEGWASCMAAPWSAKVVLLKAGTSYYPFYNVKKGDQLCSGSGQDISHLSAFQCDGQPCGS